MKNWKSAFSMLVLAVGVFACLQSFAPAKIERSRVIKKDFDGKPSVAALHQFGPLVVKKSADNKVHLIAEMLVTGNDEEDIEAVLGRFDIEVRESASALELKTDLGIESCNNINGKTTVKYRDGFKVKGVNSYKVNMTLELPNTEKLELQNKYDKIEIQDDFNGSLRVDLYSGELLAANLGYLDLDLKYGKAKIGNLGKGDFKVYDSELRAGNAQLLRVDSKYSEFELGSVAGNIELKTYDEHWKMGNVSGALTLDDKYSDFVFGNIGNAKMVVYDAEFKAEQVGDLEITDSKYSEYKLSSVGDMKLRSIFDDDYRIGSAKSVVVTDSKYSEFRIQQLEKQFRIEHSFDDAVVLEQVSAGFSQIGFDGKYTELKLKIAEGANFGFDFNQKYGNVKYPEKQVKTQFYVDKNGEITIKGSVGNEGSENLLKVTGFDNTVVWE